MNAYRYTITITPMTPAELQNVIDGIRERSGRKHLIHVIDKQPSSTSLMDVMDLRDELDQQRIRAEAAEAELDQYRSTVTTGGPRPKVTQQWRNGASSRPSTAPGEGL